MSISEAQELMQLGDQFHIHAIEPSRGWATFKAATFSSAPVPGAGRKWVRTSFRDDREQHDAAVTLAHSFDLSYCQWLRMLEALELEKFGMIAARKKLGYVD